MKIPKVVVGCKDHTKKVNGSGIAFLVVDDLVLLDLVVTVGFLATAGFFFSSAIG